MNRRLKYYLAGPMTGIEKFNFPMFERVAVYLREVGLSVASPHEIDHGETDETCGKLPYQQYVKASLTMMMDCDSVIVLPGWKDSRGACLELQVAKACGMELHRFDTENGNVYTLDNWEVDDAVKR